ncbi:MAG: acyl-CoA dehydrogenase [Desulfobacterales bacterium]|nr:acyl-CoA dehydrogenase [Desulfobacterales bacterium]MDX2512678.1 acyl-CoA dehydrogenase [Desulfobacterales bacterium]
MAQVISDRRDMDFVLYEQMKVEDLLAYEKYEGLNRKVFDMIISEARTFAIKELLPTYAEGDHVGLRFDKGQVKVPECFHRPHKLLIEGEWTALNEDPEVGGQGLPSSIDMAVAEYIVGGNYPLINYARMGHGTGKMVELFGTESQKSMFLKKLYAGIWGGTMLLTESNAGSDVGALTTSAVKNADGTYTIKGDKIFITNGEHDLQENIIHPVLARIEGAPAGTKGISIFLVPKIWVNEDGSLGELNDVACTGIEEKMGIHASATCSMSLGSKGGCRGFLLGEENHGMRIMFHMMNEARLGVGFQAFIHATTAYLYAVNYARERLQGRDLEKFAERDAPPVAIINHPDVRRMLLWMKAHVEGMRSFAYYTVRCFDKLANTEKEEEKEHYQGMVDLLTPLVKAYCAQRGYDVCIQAIQVYGGYGYTQEYPVEQIARDCKITSLYEGTDGIQAMDLLARKLGMKKGKVFMEFLEKIQKTIAHARKHEILVPMADKLEKAMNTLGESALHLGQKAMSPEFKKAFAHAFPFLEVMGDVTMGWMLLWRAVVASEKLQGGAKKKDVRFYEGQVQTAKFFINGVLPVTLGKMASIKDLDGSAVEIADEGFGGM